jgi:hypothetical protein
LQSSVQEKGQGSVFHHECNEVWSQTELQLFDLFTQLSTDPKVIAVENLTVQPGSGAYTPHGEISQTAKADVIICF